MIVENRDDETQVVLHLGNQEIADGQKVMVHLDQESYRGAVKIVDEFQQGKPYHRGPGISDFAHVYLEVKDETRQIIVGGVITDDIRRKVDDALLPLRMNFIYFVPRSHLMRNVWLKVSRMADRFNPTYFLQPTKVFPEFWGFDDDIPLVQTRSTRKPVPVSWIDVESMFLLASQLVIVRQDQRDKRKKHIIPTDVALRSFYYVDQLDEIIERHRPWLRFPDIDNKYRHLCSGESLKKAVVSSPSRGETATVTYRPDMADFETITTDKGGAINCYRQNPMPAVKKDGGIKPIKDLLDSWNIDDLDKRALLAWMQAMICGIRPNWGVIITSKPHGIGKNTLAEFLTHILGSWNCTNIPPVAIQEKHRTWPINVQLVVIDEVCEGNDWAAYNSLKSLVTEREMMINPKNKAEYTTEIWCAFMLFSNEDVPVKMQAEDRRFLVINGDKANRFSKEQFADLRQWFYADGGAEAMKHWALNTDVTDVIGEHDIDVAGDAPVNEAKRKVIAASRGKWAIRLEEELDGYEYVILQDAASFVGVTSQKVATELGEQGWLHVDSGLCVASIRSGSAVVQRGSVSSVVQL